MALKWVKTKERSLFQDWINKREVMLVGIAESSSSLQVFGLFLLRFIKFNSTIGSDRCLDSIFLSCPVLN